MSEHTQVDDLSPSADSPATPKKASWWEDYIDIFYAPSDVFSRRAHSGFGVPLLVVTLGVGILFLVNSGALSSITDAEFTRATASAIKKNPQLNAEALQKMRSIGETMGKIGAFIIMPVIIFLAALFLWVIGKFVGAKQTFAAAMMVSAYSYVPKVLEAAITSVQALLIDTSTLTGRFQLSLGVGRFLDPDTTSPILLAFVGRIDVFTIWVTALMAIGLSVTGKVSRAKGAIAATLLWFVAAAFAVLSAWRQMAA
jgi:hypothetical protein